MPFESTKDACYARFMQASIENDIELMKFITDTTEFNITNENNLIQKWICKNRQIHALGIIVDMEGFLPNLHMHLPIKLACSYNRLDIVKKIIKLDPTIEGGDDCLHHALKHNNEELFKLILDSVDAEIIKYKLISMFETACIQDKKGIATIIFDRIKFLLDNYQAEKLAALVFEKDYSGIFFSLLSSNEINLRKYLLPAVKSGKIKIVQAILDPDVNMKEGVTSFGSECIHDAFFQALKIHNYDIISIFLASKKVDFTKMNMLTILKSAPCYYYRQNQDKNNNILLSLFMKYNAYFGVEFFEPFIKDNFYIRSNGDLILGCLFNIKRDCQDIESFERQTDIMNHVSGVDVEIFRDKDFGNEKIEKFFSENYMYWFGGFLKANSDNKIFVEAIQNCRDIPDKFDYQENNENLFQKFKMISRKDVDLNYPLGVKYLMKLIIDERIYLSDCLRGLNDIAIIRDLL